MGNGYKWKLDVNKNKYRREHRLIRETYWGREVYINEIVHHINRNKKDNRIENLQLMSKEKHTSLHHTGMQHKHNKDYIPHNKLSQAIINQIYDLISQNKKNSEIARELKISDTCVS